MNAKYMKRTVSTILRHSVWSAKVSPSGYASGAVSE